MTKTRRVATTRRPLAPAIVCLSEPINCSKKHQESGSSASFIFQLLINKSNALIQPRILSD
jgi:hypothetical protein